MSTLQVQNSTVNGNHFVGACGVGRVLAPDLKVLGFSNMRVVDASAIPEMPANSGPVASVYLLAEHAVRAIVSANGGSIPGSVRGPWVHMGSLDSGGVVLGWWAPPSGALRHAL